MIRKPPIRIDDAPAPVTIELFASYAEARAASETNAPALLALLELQSLGSAEQEVWAVERGRELQRVATAYDEQVKRWLAPVREIEATIRAFAALDIPAEVAAACKIKGTPSTTPGRVRVPAGKLIDAAKRHLADLVSARRAAAAAEQAALLPAATTPEETTAALAALTPKAAGWVEVESWSWSLRPDAMPTAERRPDGTVALVFGPRTIPPDYFVLDTTRLDREVAQTKGATTTPGIESKVERKGHFRS